MSQKEKYLPKIASGEWRLQSMGVTEPTTGTDTTRAVTPAGLKAVANGLVPTTRQVAGKALTGDITIAASDVGAVPTSRTVNGKALSGNISIGNHLGFAIMFSNKAKILNNLSLGDREHGLMLNYANSADVSGNLVRGGAKKCLFIFRKR